MDKKEVITELGKLAARFENKETISDSDRKIIIQTLEKLSAQLKRKRMFERLT